MADSPPAKSSRRPRWGLFALALALLAIPAGWGWYAQGGPTALAGFGLGAAFGTLMALAGHGLARSFGGSGAKAPGQESVRGLLAGAFSSMIGFAAGILLLAWIWKPGVVPATITALVVYLALRFFEGLSLVSSGRREK
ncbi:MAG: hypothetical protein HY717_16850 [Planctomycetes bacterium]|nr:hypothetical protein [Planctomycetota bacterium]